MKRKIFTADASVSCFVLIDLCRDLPDCTFQISETAKDRNKAADVTQPPASASAIYESSATSNNLLPCLADAERLTGDSSSKNNAAEIVQIGEDGKRVAAKNTVIDTAPPP